MWHIWVEDWIPVNLWMMNWNTLLEAAVILGLLGHIVPWDLSENVATVQENVLEKELDNEEQGRIQAQLYIKPIPPKSYDGVADSRAYHRFVMEGQAYLWDGKVQRDWQIRILVYHLDGKVYNFYMQKVTSDDPNNWTLHKFFTELFNYCFPVDYWQWMQIKLENFYQKSNQLVSEYVFELQELFSMVVAMPAEMKVVKLWYSLNTRIQWAMWRDGLHPDTSTWDEVMAKAEVIEIADNVVDWRDGSRAQTQRGWCPNNADNSHKQNTDPASRSMTYANHDCWSDHDNQGPSQGQSTSQPRQNLTQPFKGQFQGGRPMLWTNNNGSLGLRLKKSVKFADLTDKEMAQLRAEGKCFNCKETGHMSHNCPHKNMVKGNGNHNHWVSWVIAWTWRSSTMTSET